VDAADEETLNRILWHAMKGLDARFPAEFTNWGRTTEKKSEPRPSGRARRILREEKSDSVMRAAP